MQNLFFAASVADVAKELTQVVSDTSTEVSTELPTEMQELMEVETTDDLLDWLGRFLAHIGEDVVNWFIRLGIGIIIFLLARFLLKKIIAFLGKRMDKRGVPASVKSIVLWLLKYGVLIYLVVMLLIFLDLLQSASVAAAVAAMGVGISLALQGAIKNFAGGLLLLLLKPFKEGDYIIVDGNEKFEGTVDRIHVYYTTLINVYNDKVRVPNSDLTDKTVINRMSDGNKRLELHVNIRYDENMEKALGVLREVVDADERIYKDRQAFFVHELGAHSIVLGIRCVVQRDEYLSVYWDLNKNIRLRFAEENIEIPYEQLDVHIKKD